MAKMFYRFEEAKQVLNMSDEQLKQLTREGKLREFRDGAAIMYKADQVDSLRGELGLGDAIELGPSDTAGGSAGLTDTRSNTAGGSAISLADTNSKEDTAMDLGLSGSGSGSGTGLAMASPGASKTGTSIPLSGGGSVSGIDLAGGTASGMSVSPGASGTAMSPGLGGSRAGTGVSVLGLDEGGNADPSAQTVGGSFGGEPSLDAMGSGSGLLDLSRERDDTSLGAPVLDEISGSGRGSMGGASGSSMGGSGPISNTPLTAAAAAARAGSVPIYVEAPSAFTGFAAGASAVAAALCLIALYAVAAAASNAQPTFLSFLFRNPGTPQAQSFPMLYVLGGGLLLTLVAGLIGFVAGKRR